MDNFEEILSAISQIIKINSEQTAPEAGAPFGKGARQALDLFLGYARDMGFETRNLDGYAGEVTFGEGEEFAVLAHLDVVPAGNGWSHEPFGGEIDRANGRIWGRGAMDDKGPAIIGLYALKALKDEGFNPRRKIKLIVGCNEETGWKCIDYYKEHAHMPEEGISPDADFPVIYAEKGILQLELNFKEKGDFTSLRGGERPNMVCDFCEAVKDGKTHIFRGKSAHGSTPEKGVNAIKPALEFLGLEELAKQLFNDCFSLCELKDETGVLTFSPNVIRGDVNSITITVDIRYPATLSRGDVLSRLDKRGVSYKVIHEQAPLFNDKNGKLVTTLCEVYNEVTGKNARPIAIGGGTYARALKYGAAFGPEEEGEESTIHQPDEYITFEKIEKCFEIYRRALQKLTAAPKEI